ncbi:hypothetical protein NL676_016813 [Syzygium grande]|nr:hypothetical protein NL676_016813 [Syzygium grande]
MPRPEPDATCRPSRARLAIPKPDVAASRWYVDPATGQKDKMGDGSPPRRFRPKDKFRERRFWLSTRKSKSINSLLHPHSTRIPGSEG